MSGQLRTLIYGVVMIVIGVALVFETPGTVETIGYVVVLVVMAALIARERTARR